ncbi:MAG: SPFH domain-containing protein, partial [Desulfobacterales bacterium]
MKYRNVIIPLLIAIVVLVYLSAFAVDETEQVVITQFGKVIRTKTEAGLDFKWPWRKATYFPKNLLGWDGEPGQIPTLEKTYIWVDSFARWKIVDPESFFRRVGDIPKARRQLNDIIDAAVRNLITENKLIEAVRKSNRELVLEVSSSGTRQDERDTYAITTGRQKITARILAQAKPKVAERGIALVDVKIKRINYV